MCFKGFIAILFMFVVCADVFRKWGHTAALSLAFFAKREAVTTKRPGVLWLSCNSNTALSLKLYCTVS